MQYELCEGLLRLRKNRSSCIMSQLVREIQRQADSCVYGQPGRSLGPGPSVLEMIISRQNILLSVLYKGREISELFCNVKKKVLAASF